MLVAALLSLVAVLAALVGACVAVVAVDMKRRVADQVAREKATDDLKGMLRSFEKAHNDLASGLKTVDERLNYVIAQQTKPNFARGKEA